MAAWLPHLPRFARDVGESVLLDLPWASEMSHVSENLQAFGLYNLRTYLILPINSPLPSSIPRAATLVLQSQRVKPLLTVLRNGIFIDPAWRVEFLAP